MPSGLWEAVVAGLLLAADVVVAAPVLPGDFARRLFAVSVAAAVATLFAASLSGRTSPFSGSIGVFVGLLAAMIGFVGLRAKGIELSALLPLYFGAAVLLRLAEGLALGCFFTGSRSRQAMLLVFVLSIAGGAVTIQWLTNGLTEIETRRVELAWSMVSAISSAAVLARRVSRQSLVFGLCAFMVFSSVNLCIPHNPAAQVAHSLALPIGVVVTWIVGLLKPSLGWAKPDRGTNG